MHAYIHTYIYTYLNTYMYIYIYIEWIDLQACVCYFDFFILLKFNCFVSICYISSYFCIVICLVIDMCTHTHTLQPFIPIPEGVS